MPINSTAKCPAHHLEREHDFDDDESQEYAKLPILAAVLH